MNPGRGLVAGPPARVALGVAGLLVSGVLVGRGRVAAAEQAVFRRLNELPDALYSPAWLVMQAGTIGAVPVAAVTARVAGEGRLARRFLVAGTLAWLAAKAVKRAYRRPRPATLLPTARTRGVPPTGMGYVSGHAAVVTALALGAWPDLRTGGRAGALVVVPLVATTRVYVGAHLPLDVVGGAALGMTVDGLVDLMARRGARRGR